MMVIGVGLVFFLEILSGIYCLNYLYGNKPRFDVWTVSIIVLDVIWMCIIRFLHLGNGWSLIMYPIIMLYCGLEFGFDFKKILVNNIIYLIIISVLQATAMILWLSVFEIKKTEMIGNLFVSIFTFAIVILGLKRCNLKKLSGTLQSKEKLVIVSFVTVTVSIFLFLSDFKKNSEFNPLHYVVLGISIFLIVMVIVDIGKHKIRMKEAEAELRLHKLYEASFQTLIDDISAKQHEFDNHINTIFSQHFLYKTYDELVGAQKKYCVEVLSENKYNKLLSKGNPIILGFLYSKFSEIEKKKIELTYKVNIDNLNCKVPIYKIVELLGNLINNAVDAVQDKNGSIYVMILEECGRIQIEVANESIQVNYKKIQDFFKKGYSEKGKNRGYGLYNVKRICEEYGLSILCENHKISNKNWLVFSIIINKSL